MNHISDGFEPQDCERTEQHEVGNKKTGTFVAAIAYDSGSSSRAIQGVTLVFALPRDDVSPAAVSNRLECVRLSVEQISLMIAKLTHIIDRKKQVSIRPAAGRHGIAVKGRTAAALDSAKPQGDV